MGKKEELPRPKKIGRPKKDDSPGWRKKKSDAWNRRVKEEREAASDG